MEKRNISVARINGYTYEKVIKAQGYLKEIGSNRRAFPFDKLVRYYNDILGTKDSEQGCKCQAPKYYNGIANYVKFGKLTLINNGLATEADFEEKKVEEKIENADNRIVLGDVSEASESVSEDKVEDSPSEDEEAVRKAEMKERMAKVRAAKGKKKEEEDVENRD